MGKLSNSTSDGDLSHQTQFGNAGTRQRACSRTVVQYPHQGPVRRHTRMHSLAHIQASGYEIIPPSLHCWSAQDQGKSTRSQICFRKGLAYLVPFVRFPSSCSIPHSTGSRYPRHTFQAFMPEHAALLEAECTHAVIARFCSILAHRGRGSPLYHLGKGPGVGPQLHISDKHYPIRMSCQQTKAHTNKFEPSSAYKLSLHSWSLYLCHPVNLRSDSKKQDSGSVVGCSLTNTGYCRAYLHLLRPKRVRPELRSVGVMRIAPKSSDFQIQYFVRFTRITTFG